MVSSSNAVIFLSRLLPRVDSSLTSQGRRLAMLELVVLTVGAFFRTARFGVVPSYGSVTMHYESALIGLTGSFGFALLVVETERWNIVSRRRV